MITELTRAHFGRCMLAEALVAFTRADIPEQFRLKTLAQPCTSRFEID